jgi:S-(hydroxymethyl)glutathione dehydrogenase/alcohol dehydrogenase
VRTIPDGSPFPLTFRAAVLEASRQPLVLGTVTWDGPLERGQVLVQVRYSGICGKQLEEIDGARGPDPFLPHLLGHEGSGIVTATGPGVRKVRPGDAVVLHWLKGSGLDAATPVYRQDGRRIQAGWVTTFNEYAVVPENRVTPVPDGTDLAQACLLGCAVTTGVGAVLKELRHRPGTSLAVFGCGGVGLNAVQGAALACARPIIAVDPNPRSLALARALGATHLVDSRTTNPVQAIRELTGGLGARSVVVAVGHPGAIEAAVESASAPGTVLLAGVPPAGARIQVDPGPLHGGRTITGSHGGGTAPDQDIPAYLALHAQGRLKLKELVSGEVPLERINDAICSLRTGTPGRLVIRF